MERSDIREIRMTVAEGKPWGDKQNVHAYSSVTFQCGLTVRGIKIMTSKTGNLFVAMPSRMTMKNGEKSYEDSATFFDKDDRNAFSAILLGEFEKAKAAKGKTSGPQPSKATPTPTADGWDPDSDGF